MAAMRGLSVALRGQRTRTSRGVIALVAAAVLLVIAAAGLVAHYRAPGRGWMLGVSAFSPYLMLGAPLAVLLLAVAREWVGTLLAVVVTAIAVTTQAPLYVAEDPPAHARDLVVMTSNLKLGSASPASLVAAVRRDHVEVLMTQEMTPQEQARLERAGLNQLLPQHVTDARPEAAGTGLWSRYPLQDSTARTELSWAFVTARVELPGVTARPLLGALHLHGPYPDSNTWHRDIRRLRTVLPTLGGRGTAVLAGDFNATADLHQFRELLNHGWADGADQAGAGLTRTFPSDTALTPLIAIDHVLTRRAVARTASTVQIAGTDHRALLVTVAVPTPR